MKSISQKPTLFKASHIIDKNIFLFIKVDLSEACPFIYS